MENDVRNLVVLGSTGSIGRQTLALLEQTDLGKRYRVFGLAAYGRNLELLVRQVGTYGPRFVAVYHPGSARELESLFGDRVQVLSGTEGVETLVRQPEVDVVVSGIAGTSALRPTFAAVDEGKTVCLANKESLVALGPLLVERARQRKARLIPVDSEHNAILQILGGFTPRFVRKVLLTASGGPFREVPLERLPYVTPEEALRHPTWKMGPLVTVNSATLMNKGQEILEARYLFDLPLSAVDAVIHPQSLVHAIVEFTDGTQLLQAGPSDMRWAIQYALTYPDRLPGAIQPVDFQSGLRLDFEPINWQRYPCYRIAREVAEEGGLLPAVMTAANEVAVSAFLERKLPFTGIPEVIEQTLEIFGTLGIQGLSLERVLQADREARRIAMELLNRRAKASP